MTEAQGDFLDDAPSEAGSDGSARAQISREILRIHLDSYGVGAETIEVHLLDDLVLVLLDGLQLQASEKTLIAGGHVQIVERMRSEFQSQIGSTFSAVVERATGRKVSSFLSNTDLLQLFSVEFFRLHPVGA